MERFSEERLKAALGPLGSMMKISDQGGRSPQSVVTAPGSALASALGTAGRDLRWPFWSLGMSATSGTPLEGGLASFQVSGPLSSLQLTPN